jgi:hypothetical protein
MALRPILVLSLLTFALVAGCSDGPASGDLVAIPGALTVEGTAENTYVAANYPTANPVPGGEPICPDPAPDPSLACTDPSSHYKFHVMSLPEPSGDGYTIVQVGGTIEERTLVKLVQTPAGMWEAEISKEGDQGEDQSSMFDHFELRMGDFVVATASAASGSQAFVASPLLSTITVTGSYKGRNLELDVQGLPSDVEPGDFVGRFYAEGLNSGNLTLVESFPIIAGAQTLVTEQADVGDYVEFHIHVGTSKIYVYQATL